MALLEPELEAQRERHARRSIIMSTLVQIVEPLAKALGRAEVVVHDLSDLDHSVIAISGGLTGRKPGDPATDLLIRMVKTATCDHQIGYRTQLPGERDAKSSTILIRDPQTNEAMAALCFNVDVTDLEAIRNTVDNLLGVTPVERPEEAATEVFPSSVDALLEHSVDRAIDEVGIEVTLMKKHHKVAVVAALQEQGVFQIRDAVEFIADRLGVTRFTIYNYLNEIQA